MDLDRERGNCCGPVPRDEAEEVRAAVPAEENRTSGPDAGARLTKRPDETRKKLVNRLNRIEGQIRGIRQMIENDAYCNDVLTQSAAAGAALSAFNRELIAAHLRGCVARDLREGDDGVIDELLVTLQKMMK